MKYREISPKFWCSSTGMIHKLKAFHLFISYHEPNEKDLRRLKMLEVFSFYLCLLSKQLFLVLAVK